MCLQAAAWLELLPGLNIKTDACVPICCAVEVCRRWASSAKESFWRLSQHGLLPEQCV